MEKLLIRKTVESDLQSLIDLNHVIWNTFNTPSEISFRSVEEYANYFPPGSQFVAIIADQVAGYMDYKNPTPLESNKHVLEIDMGVSPDFQRMGVGKALMDYILFWAKEGYLKVSLRVLSTNEKAISFYQANGFNEQGRLINEFLLDGKLVDDILMYKML